MGFLTDVLHLGLSLLGDRMERRLGQRDSEIERLRCQLDSERRDLDEARRQSTSAGEIIEMQKRRIEELEALLSRLTPRTCREGDPQPKERFVPWWRGERWGWGSTRAELLDHGDIYIDLPPPSEWPQPWTGGSGTLDPAQQHAYDALERVTKERDEARAELGKAGGWQKEAMRLRESYREAQDALIRAESDANYANAKLARLRPHYDAIMVLAGACDGDPNDPASVATTFLDIGKAMLQARRERDSIREDLDAARAEAKAGMDAYLVERRKRGEAEAELARLREQITPRRDPPPKKHIWWDAESHMWYGTSYGRRSESEWWLPQPPPPPDEPRQKATNPEEQESEGVTRA